MSAAVLTSVGNQLVDPAHTATVDVNELTYLEQDLATGEGNYFVNDATTCLVVRNSGATDHTITFSTQHPDSVGTLVNPVAGTTVITIPDAGAAVIGPFDPSVFDIHANGRVYFVASDTELKGYTVGIVGAGLLSKTSGG